MQKPPIEPVWWFATNQKTGTPAYTKTRTWYDARKELGGEPMRVTDPDTIQRLDESARS